MVDNIILAVLILILGNSIYIYYKKKKELLNIEEINIGLLRTNDEIKKLLAIGIYWQFNKDDIAGKGPTDFEAFVAKVMENYYGGKVYLRGGSGDYGVDIEQEREDGTYLGQVKCYAPTNQVPFDPIALIHSNMVKENAKGGFVVTTGSYTENALKYSTNLNIELIDGIKLVDYWLVGLERQLGLAKAIKQETNLVEI